MWADAGRPGWQARSIARLPAGQRRFSRRGARLTHTRAGLIIIFSGQESKYKSKAGIEDARVDDDVASPPAAFLLFAYQKVGHHGLISAPPAPIGRFGEG